MNKYAPPIMTGVINRLVEYWLHQGCHLSALENAIGESFDTECKRFHRVPVNCIARLFNDVSSEVEDPLLGLNTGLGMETLRLGVISNIFMYAPTVHEAIKSMIAFSPLYAHAISFDLSMDNTLAYFSIDPNPTESVSHHQVDAFVASAVKLLYTVVPESSLTIYLVNSLPGYHELYARKCKASVFFNRERNQIVFERHYLDLPVPWEDAMLFEASQRLAKASHSAIQENTPLPVLVKEYLIGRLVYGVPSQENVATALNMGVRNFQLKLKNHNVCFRDLVAESRKETAMRLIENGQISSDEIANRLGYADTANYYRAFKRWTGTSVLEYARNVRQQPLQ